MKNSFLLVLCIFYFLSLSAQDPNWSLDTSKYQYSMTFTAFVNVNGKTLSSVEDKVGAFVNGEIRGVASVEYLSSINKYIVFLSVYANTNGETINFKIFDSTTQNVFDISTTKNFLIDGNVGGGFQSYSIANPVLNSNAILNSFSFSGITAVSQNINNNSVDIVLPANTNLTNLAPTYNISDGATFFVNGFQQVSGVSNQDFTNEITYKLLSANQENLVSYQVKVSLEIPSTPKPELLLESASNTLVKQAPVIVKMQTNVAIFGFTTQDFLLTNAVVSSINKVNDFNYSFQIIPIQQGYFSVEIPANVVFNNDSKGNLASNKLSFTYDLVRPYVTSIKRKTPVNEITDTDTLVFTVTFSEPVNNVFSTDFKSFANAIINIAKETDAIYTITILNEVNFVGAVSLNIKSTNSIQDKSGNQLINTVINVHQN